MDKERDIRDIVYLKPFMKLTKPLEEERGNFLFWFFLSIALFIYVFYNLGAQYLWAP